MKTLDMCLLDMILRVKMDTSYIKLDFFPQLNYSQKDYLHTYFSIFHPHQYSATVSISIHYVDCLTLFCFEKHLSS